MERLGKKAALAKLTAACSRARAMATGRMARLGIEARRRLRVAAGEERGQGTTEYAILVGVLVVIAIVAIVAFRGRIQELWTAISDGINGL